MNRTYYEEYLNFQNQGLKTKATDSLRKFIDSFQEEEKEEWVWSNLGKLGGSHGGTIRHEIFRDIIFPVLKNGYLRNDPKALIWLYQCWGNVCQDKKIFLQINDYPYNWFKKYLELNPDNKKIKEKLLEIICADLRYRTHHAGRIIIYRPDDSANELRELLDDLELGKNLDEEKKYLKFFEKVAEDIADCLKKKQ